jgi:hypothetical protein
MTSFLGDVKKRNKKLIFRKNDEYEDISYLVA